MIAFKVYYVVTDLKRDGRDEKIYTLDVAFSVVVTTFSIVIIITYAILLCKFMALIKRNNGFLDFMRVQVVFFFSFLIFLMSVKAGSLVIVPVEFDAIMDRAADEDESLTTG